MRIRSDFRLVSSPKDLDEIGFQSFKFSKYNNRARFWVNNLHKNLNEIEFGIEHFDNFSFWWIFDIIVVHLSSSLLHQTCFSLFHTQPRSPFWQQIPIIPASPWFRQEFEKLAKYVVGGAQLTKQGWGGM